MNDETNQGDPQDGEPKIIVDSDWKEQVAREKEQASAASSEVSSEAAKEASKETSEKTKTSPTELPPPPPASFEVLVYSLFTQAMSWLGHSVDPEVTEAPVNKPYAKHFIDTLEMLGEKTKGNLSDQEASMLEGILHTLRMTYVNVKKS